MKRLRTALIVIFIILIAGNLLLTDYRDIFSRANLSEGLGILCALCMILAMVLSNRYDAKQNGK